MPAKTYTYIYDSSLTSSSTATPAAPSASCRRPFRRSFCLLPLLLLPLLQLPLLQLPQPDQLQPEHDINPGNRFLLYLA